jgi:hypothetical protein
MALGILGGGMNQHNRNGATALQAVIEKNHSAVVKVLPEESCTSGT